MMQVFNPMTDTFEHEGIRFLLVSKELVLTFSKVLLELKHCSMSITVSIISVPQVMQVEKILSYAEKILCECLHIARSYYEYWLLHHQLRVIILLILDIDIAESYIAIKRHRLWSNK